MIRLLVFCWEYSQQTDYAVIRLQTDLFIQQTPVLCYCVCLQGAGSILLELITHILTNWSYSLDFGLAKTIGRLKG